MKNLDIDDISELTLGFEVGVGLVISSVAFHVCAPPQVRRCTSGT